MTVQERRDVVKTGLKVVVEAVEETMTGISDTLTKERKERKEEEEWIGDRIDKTEKREGYNEDRMRKMEERIDEKENKVVDTGQDKKGGGQTAGGDVGYGGQN